MGIWKNLTGRFKGEQGHGVHWEADPGPPRPGAVYQIVYSEETRAALDPGFLCMDNTANRRPDWREYHPMRSFLLQEPLDDQRFYGFLSPRFAQKTGVNASQLHAFIEKHQDADVLLFSAFLDLQALFRNSFVQGEHFHPGLLLVAEALFGDSGFDVELASLVMDNSCSVFCNYFVAKPAFWRAWLQTTEALYRHAEGRGSLHRMVTRNTRYNGKEDVQMKIFIMERIADLLLTTQPNWKAASYFSENLSNRLNPKLSPAHIAQCNSLKASFRATGNQTLMERYKSLAELVTFR